MNQMRVVIRPRDNVAKQHLNKRARLADTHRVLAAPTARPETPPVQHCDS